jgi:uncharacterized metal-binding protein YceD (DUF177 family)
MEAAGYEITHPHNKVFYHGIRLLSEFEELDDDKPILIEPEEIDVEAFIQDCLYA